MTTPSQTHQRILVNAFTTPEAIVLVAPMPGVLPDDVEITVDGRLVTLRAALRTDAPKQYFLREWEYGDYERTVELPEPVGAPVSATLGNGQLAVSLRRRPEHPGPEGEVLTARPTAAGSDRG